MASRVFQVGSSAQPTTSTSALRNLTHYIARGLLEPAASDHTYILNWDEPALCLMSSCP